MDNDKLFEVNPYFEKVAKERGFYSRELMDLIAKKGSIQDFEGIPEDVKIVFVTAHDVSPESHIRMQAAFQKHTDNAVSKTVNLPENATVEDVKNIFMLAYDLKCKGITVYRDGSRHGQVLSVHGNGLVVTTTPTSGDEKNNRLNIPIILVNLCILAITLYLSKPSQHLQDPEGCLL